MSVEYLSCVVMYGVLFVMYGNTFRCLMLILSGPIELWILQCLMAPWNCDVVICIDVTYSLLMWQLLCLYWMCCFIVLVSCLLNAFVNCLSVIVVLLLNIMVLFCVWVGLLSPCMVFHALVLWPHCLFRSSLRCLLCVCSDLWNL